MEVVCSGAIVLPDLLAEHELTVLSVESGRSAVWTVTTVLHGNKETYMTAVQVRVSCRHDSSLKLFCREWYSVCVSAAHDCIEQTFSYYLCRDLFDFEIFSVFYSECFSLSSCCCCLKGSPNLMTSLGSGGNRASLSENPKLLPGCRIIVLLVFSP